MSECGLIDIGFSGHPFTWTNRRYGKDFICVRLDRALANLEWNNQFPEAKLYHLTSCYSDHSHILLHTDDQNKPGRKPFRFQNAWITESSFARLWKRSGTLKRMEIRIGNSILNTLNLKLK